MYMWAKHYTEPGVVGDISKVLDEICFEYEAEPIFICIGSDRHLLDCLGPLTGTMVKEAVLDIKLYGTLKNPLNSANISSFISELNSNYPSGYVQIAIDASLGNIEDLGMIKIRKGPILPGKALDKRLPPVGQIAITGIVGEKLSYKNLASLKTGSIMPVYYMAKVLSEAIILWYLNKK